MGETTAGEGAYFTWTSEHSGNGKMTITESRPNESIKMVVNFEAPLIKIMAAGWNCCWLPCSSERKGAALPFRGRPPVFQSYRMI